MFAFFAPNFDRKLTYRYLNQIVIKPPFVKSQKCKDSRQNFRINFPSLA